MIYRCSTDIGQKDDGPGRWYMARAAALPSAEGTESRMSTEAVSWFSLDTGHICSTSSAAGFVSAAARLSLT